MNCPMCRDLGTEDEHESMLHAAILEWQEKWAGSAGWQRKQALMRAKRDARAILSPAAAKKGSGR